MHVCMYVYKFVCVCNVHLYMCIYLYVFVGIYIFLNFGILLSENLRCSYNKYTCMYVCMYVCKLRVVFIPIRIHTYVCILYEYRSHFYWFHIIIGYIFFFSVTCVCCVLCLVKNKTREQASNSRLCWYHVEPTPGQKDP